MGPQGPLHAFALALSRGYRRRQRPGLQRTEHRDRRRHGNLGLRRAGRRARHAAGQHPQFDPEPDDLPAVAVQRPRRLVLHGNRLEGHASGAVGSREDHFRPLSSGLQGPGARPLGHSRRKQLDHQRRSRGGLRRNRRQPQMGLERLRRLRAPLEKHRRLLPDGRQHLLHGLHLGEHLQLHGRHGVLLDRPGVSRRDEGIGLLREFQPQLVQLQARRTRLFGTDTLHPGISPKTDRL